MNAPSEPWQRWISVLTVHDLYEEGIKRWGGAHSASQRGCIEAALGAAYNAELYSAADPNEGEQVIGGIVFAAFVLFYLATKHCYVDGNKRVAWSTSMFALLRLGLTVRATDDEAEAFCKGIASGEITSGIETANWIFERLEEVV